MPNQQVGMAFLNYTGSNGEVRFKRYTDEQSTDPSIQLSTAAPWYPQLTAFSSELVAAYVDTRAPNSGKLTFRVSTDNGVTWGAEFYPLGAATFATSNYAPVVVGSRDGFTLYVFAANSSGTIPQYWSTTDPTLATWSGPAAAGDASMYVASNSGCGNAGQECYRARSYTFTETATVGQWVYITLSYSDNVHCSRGTQVGTLGGSWSPQVDHYGGCGISGGGGESTATAFVDRAGAIYYLRADEYGTNVYYQKSTDGGFTWGNRVYAYSTSQPAYLTAAPVGIYVPGYTQGEYVWWAGWGGTEDTVRVDGIWTQPLAYPDTGTARIFGSAGGDWDAGLAWTYTFGRSDPDASADSGVYTTSAEDLALPGRLLNLSFSRTYNSADTTPGPLGPGWTHSYNWKLTENSTLVQIRRGDGRRDKFTAIGGGAYSDPPNVFDTLIKNGDGTFTLTLTNQVQYEFNNAGILSRIHEPAGNQITLGYTSPDLVTAPIGGTASYSAIGTFSSGYLPAFAANGSKSNSTGVNVSWAKNGWSSGDWWQVNWTNPQPLMRVRLWDRSASTDSFGTSGHLSFSDGSTVGWTGLPDDAGPTGANYLELSFPRKTGITWLRVVSDAGGVGNTGLAEVEAYDDASGPSTEALPKIITDPVGRQVTLTYNGTGHLSQLQDPLGRNVTYSYDGLGRLIGVNDKFANRTASPYQTTVLADAPSGYWRYDETSGTVVADQRGVQNGTTFGGVTRGDSGIAGSPSSLFDGGSGFVSIPDAAPFDFGTGDFTVEAWAHRTMTGANSWPIIVSKRPWQTGVEPGWSISSMTADPTKLALHLGNKDLPDAGMQTATGVLTANVWHHVALVYTASDKLGRLYVDGTLVLTTPPTDGTTGATSTAAITMGRNNAGTGDYYGGRIDEVAIYPTALSAARVLAHYQAARPSWAYGYEATGQHSTTITDPDGRIRVTNTYDAAGRLYTQKDGLQKQTTFAYSPSQTVITDPKLHQTTLTFDARARLLSQSDVVSGITRTLQYAYDDFGNRNVVIDRDGNRTDFTYDSSGNVLSKTDPLLNPQTPRYVTDFTYDSKNNVTVILDPRNFITTNTYDSTTNVLLSTTAQIDQTTSAVTKYEYGDVANPGLPTRIISPRGNTGPTPNYTYSQALTYDTQANLVTRIDADGAETTYGYDSVGRRTSMVDPDGYGPGGVPAEHTWLTAYDENDRVTSQADPLSHSTTNGYNGSGDRTSRTDRDGNVTTYAYDNAARLATVAQKPDPVNQPTLVYTTTLTRDDNGNATKVTQANNVVTDYTFDELNRLLSVITHPTVSTSLTTSYVLNGNGQPTTKTTGDGVAISYVYDTMARLISVSATGLSTITYGYDELSHRVAMTDGTGNTTCQYDGLGRLTQGAQPNGTTTYGYDLDSNRTTLGYPTVGNVTYVYSPGGRLNTVTDWATHNATYSYSPAGLASSVAVPGGMTTTYTYDKAHRLTQLVNAVGANTVSSHAYTLDNEGNRTALDELVSGITLPPVQSFPSARVNDDTGTTVQDHPAIALGADAASYLIWDDARLGNADIEFARRDPVTGTWSANVKVNTDTGTRIQQNPAISLDSSNNAYAVWQDERNGAGKPDIYYSKRTASNGIWLTPNLKVNDDAGGGGGAIQRNPRIAGTAAGAETAIWVDFRSSQTNIYGSTLAAGGSAWAANKQVSDNTAAAKDSPDLVVGADGTSYAVWQDSRNGNADIYFSKLTSGGSAWSANVKVSDDPGTAAQTAPRIGIDSAGNLTVVWLDARTSPAQLRVSRQTAGSNTWSASTVLNDAAARPTGTIALSERADGSAWVAWSDTRGTSTDIWGSRYLSGTWSTSQLLSDDPGAAAQANPALAYSTAELAMAWRDDRAGNADVRGGRIHYNSGVDHFGYTYDGLERLTAGTTTNAESFTLDAGSNIASRTGPTATYTYDTANRLTNDGTQAFTWNTADRLTNRGSDTFGYDPLDRMTSSTVAATSRTYAYNGDALLQSRTQGATTTFLWDPSTSPSRLLVQGSDRLIYGLGPLWVVKGDGSTSSFARDGGKSVRAEVSGSGTVTASFRYRAYGAIAQSTGASMPTYLGYAGQLQDSSGLLYMRARWYDAAAGRFITHDPLEGAVGDPSRFNSYAYAAANPLLMADPSGLIQQLIDPGVPLVEDPGVPGDCPPDCAGWGPSGGTGEGSGSAAAAEPQGIVYLRSDLNGGRPYVGQTINEGRYLARQAEHARANPDADFDFEILGRAKPGTELDRVEEYFIRWYGGPTNASNPLGGLANLRHQMSDLRYGSAGEFP